jgi:hypothetical protein
MWEQYKPIIRGLESRNNPEHLSTFDYLNNEAQNRDPNIKP